MSSSGTQPQQEPGAPLPSLGLLDRKMSLGRIYLKILENYTERRDEALLLADLLEESGTTMEGPAAEATSSDRSTESTTDYLWSRRTLAQSSYGSVAPRGLRRWTWTWRGLTGKC